MQSQKFSARTASLPSPIGGWNARDSLANMDAMDAVTMLNWFPTPTDIQFRKGYTKRTTGFTGVANSLMNWAGPSSQILFAAVGTVIYNVQGSTATSSVTGLGSDKWQHVNITTSGGHYLVICNGVDAVRVFDGTTWTTPTITGVTSSNLVNVNLFKNRLYFTEKNTLKVWYLPVNSIAGAASPLDFGAIARNGGYLQAMGTWTLDAGQGADDYAVFVTSMGEIIVYNGTDPTDAATWALIGVWALGQTFNRRCFFKWSGDLLLLTQDGLVPLASALQSSRLDPRVNLTDKIYYAISQAATLYSTNFGWQIAYYASQNMLIINVPFNTGPQQFVMNTISKAWASFSNINAQCWELSNDQMYFGSTGYIGHFWDAYSDNGSNINADIQQAYSYFDARGQLKRFTMIRPIFQTDNGVPGVLAGINVDFAVQNDLGAVSFNAQNVAIGSWDNAIWDTSQWGGTLSITKSWQGVTGLGYSGGVAMKIASQGIDVHWASTDYVMERGGVL
jgi:hypothetical protein